MSAQIPHNVYAIPNVASFFNQKMLPMVYKLHSNKNNEISLVPYEEQRTVPKKVYGNTNKDVIRYWNRFVKASSSIGVMLTGDSGSGKTLVGDLLSNLGIRNGLAVIMITEIKVDENVLKFLSALDDCIVFFDEFTKNVGYDMQQKMLTLMTDKSHGKKLFVLTENERSSISRFIVNRPGRAYYAKDYQRIDVSVILDYIADFKVTDQFRKELLERYKTTTVFSFDHLIALVTEHLDYPHETIDELLEYLNVDLFTRPLGYKIKKIIKDSEPDKEVEFSPMEIIVKEFDTGRPYWLNVSGAKTNIKIYNKLITNIENDIVTIKTVGYTITMEKTNNDEIVYNNQSGGMSNNRGFSSGLNW